MRSVQAIVVSTMCSLLVATGALAQPAPASAASGHWQGEIQIPDRVLSFTVDLAKNAAGAWIGSMTVSGTTSVDVPLTGIAVADSGVRFDAKLPEDARFQGTVSADGKGLSGTVANDQGAVPFVLTRSGEANVKVPPPSSPLVKSFEGTWNGAIQVPGRTPIRVILKLSAAPDGTALATIVNVDQGNEEIPMTTVITNGNQLQMDTRLISSGYQGTLGPDGTITGEWAQGGARVALTFRR
jgi:hypothetical protein